MKLVVSCLLILLACEWSYSQRIPLFQVNSVFMEEVSHFAAPTHFQEKEYAQVGGIFSSGLFKELRRFYFAGIKKLPGDQGHAAGVSILRAQRGDQIQETVINGVYKIDRQLSDKLTLSVGSLIGVYNAGIDASMVSPGDNGWSFNLDLSSTLRSDKWSASLYMKHATAPDILLLESTASYPRFFGAFGHMDLVDRPTWNSRLTVHATSLYGDTFVTTSFDQTLWDQFTVAANLGNKSIGFFTGFRDLPVDNFNLKLLLGYQSPFASDAFSTFTRLQVHLAVY